MAIGLKQNGPFAFSIGGNGASTWDTDANAAALEAALASGTNTLTAFAGGGQASATALPSAYNRVNVVGTAGDSVKLPASKVGPPIVVRNAAAASLNVFPQTGEAINEAGANAAFAVAAGKSAVFFCTAVGQWIAVLSA